MLERELQFLKEVSDELLRIQKICKPTEIAKLRFIKFSSSSSVENIYGQLTGEHNSARANAITKKRYGGLSTFKNSDDYFSKGSLVTALEKYMYEYREASDEISDIFKFLKGETSLIRLKFNFYTLDVHSRFNENATLENVTVENVNIPNNTIIEIHEVKELKF